MQVKRRKLEKQESGLNHQGPPPSDTNGGNLTNNEKMAGKTGSKKKISGPIHHDQNQLAMGEEPAPKLQFNVKPWR